MIFDTHAHFDDEAFDNDRRELLLSMKANNVDNIVNVGATLKGSYDSLALSREYSFIYAAMGIHPSEIKEMNDENFDILGKDILKNAYYNGGKVVAVGEIGLDYYYPEPERELQKDWFDRQLKLSKEVKLPIIIHSRDAAKDTLDILKANDAKDIGGIIHCYSYSEEIAREYLDMGFFFGIGGVLTFKKSQKIKDVVSYLPMDMIVLETDSPYLSPEPLRGKRNDSSKLIYVAQKISEIKNIPVDEVIDITEQNARRVYRLNANIG